MGAVIEYESRKGDPWWTKPAKDDWAYGTFAGPTPTKVTDATMKVPGGCGGYNRWTISGKSWPDSNPLFAVQAGNRYRLLMHNSGDVHPVRTHRHTFEVTKPGRGSRGQRASVWRPNMRAACPQHCRFARRPLIFGATVPHSGQVEFCRAWHYPAAKRAAAPRRAYA
jgi:Multicopper oxidase